MRMGPYDIGIVLALQHTNARSSVATILIDCTSLRLETLQLVFRLCVEINAAEVHIKPEALSFRYQNLLFYVWLLFSKPACTTSSLA